MCQSVPIYYPFSTFSIVYSCTATSGHRQDRTPGRDSPSLSVRSPCTTGLRFEAGPWGGMRLSSRESLPPQKFISHVDFSFFHSLKLISIGFFFVKLRINAYLSLSVAANPSLINSRIAPVRVLIPFSMAYWSTFSNRFGGRSTLTLQSLAALLLDNICIPPKKLFILHYPGRLRFLYSFYTQFIPFSENISKTTRKHIENNLISYHICSFIHARI